MLNRLDIRLADIGSTYLTAPTIKQCYAVNSDEFGPDLKGQTLEIVQPLYVPKFA